MPTGKKKFSLTVGYCRTHRRNFPRGCAGSSKILVSPSEFTSSSGRRMSSGGRVSMSGYEGIHTPNICRLSIKNYE
jgi:hypothetical protein